MNERIINRLDKSLAIFCGVLPGLFLLVTSTTNLNPEQFVYDIKRMLELVIIVLLFLVAGLNPGIRAAYYNQLARVPRWIGTVLGLIVLLGVISSWASATSTAQAINSVLEVLLLTMLGLGALVIAACREIAGKLFDQVVIAFLAMASITVGMQELLGVVAALNAKTEYFSRISLLYYSWPRFYNQVQAWVLIPMGLIPLIWASSRSEMLQSRVFQALVCLTALAMHWNIILMSGGRGVAISLLLTFALCLLLLPAIRGQVLRWHLPGLLIGASLFYAILVANENVQEAKRAANQPSFSQSIESYLATPVEEADDSEEESRFRTQSMTGRLSLESSGRKWMWLDAAEYIKLNPALGIGPMNYACVGPDYRAGHPHNFPLQFAAEWGLPATLGLAVVVLALLGKLWRTLRCEIESYTTRLASMLATALVAAMIYSGLSGVVVMPASQVMGLLVVGWLLGALPVKQVNAEGRKQFSSLILAVMILVSGLVTAFSYSELGQREYRESVIPMIDQGIPRYWQQGKQCKYFENY